MDELTTEERIAQLERIVRILANGLLLIDAAKDLSRDGVKANCQEIAWSCGPVLLPKKDDPGSEH